MNHHRFLLLAAAILVAACSPGASASPLPSASAAAGPTATVVASSPSPTPGVTAPARTAPFGRILLVTGSGSAATLAVVVPDGSGLAKIKGTAGAGAPAWSPDGSRIAFERGQVVVAAADGSGSAPVTSLSGLVSEVPAWSPDGSQLAFIARPLSSDSAGSSQLDVVRVDGSGLTTLNALPSGDRPAWSPDGRSIVYANADNGGLASISIATGVVTRLTTEDDSFAAWSPDGSRLLFERGAPQADGTEVHQLLVLEADGRLTTITSGPADDEFPAWSPDGAWIAFTRFSGGHVELWLVRSDGTDAARVAIAGPSEVSWPSWTR